MKVWSHALFGGLSMVRYCSVDGMKEYQRIVV